MTAQHQTKSSEIAKRVEIVREQHAVRHEPTGDPQYCWRLKKGKRMFVQICEIGLLLEVLDAQ